MVDTTKMTKETIYTIYINLIIVCYVNSLVVWLGKKGRKCLVQEMELSRTISLF